MNTCVLLARQLQMLCRPPQDPVFRWCEDTIFTLTMPCNSNDDFLLHYGFVPAGNVHDDFVLFDSIDAALQWHRTGFPAKVGTRQSTMPGASCFRCGYWPPLVCHGSLMPTHSW